MRTLQHHPCARLHASLVLAVVTGCTAGTDPGGGAAGSGFVDVRATAGIDVGSTASSLRVGPMNAAAIGDCDADGLPDAFVFNWVGSGVVYRNTGAMHFERLAPIAGLTLAPSSASFGDLDNDGLVDLVVGTGFEELQRYQVDHQPPLAQGIQVFRNTGHCTFTDVTQAWGFASSPAPTQSLIAGVDLIDVNLDGRLDLLSRRILWAEAPLELYLSRPDGTWEEAADRTLGHLTGSNWTSILTDVDDDGLSDLFVLFDRQQGGGPARYLHRTSATDALAFTETPFDAAIFGPTSGQRALMGATSGDFDGDGRLDLFFADLGPQHLYRHAASVVDGAAAAGVNFDTLPSGGPTVAYGPRAVDYDNDGHPDLVVACGTNDGYFSPPIAFLFHNRGDGTFDDQTRLLHQPETYASQWLGVSDLDRDGRVDVFMGGSAVQPRVLHNEFPSARSIAIRLHGTTSNREGVGAKVTVTAGSRTLVQEMFGGGAPWGYSEHRLVFGLGDATHAERVEVRWPSGYTQRVDASATTAPGELVVTEPDLVRVDPLVSRAGDDVRVTLRPSALDGSLLGSGHTVVVTTDAIGASATTTDNHDGTYVATLRGVSPGTYGITASIDGAALYARPRFTVR